jgi:hypothetical protein
MRSSNLLDAYRRARFFRKAMLAVFVLIFACTIAYAIPWIPGGLEKDDYNQRTLILMAMVMAAATTAFGSIYMRDTSKRIEQTIDTWTSVHQGLGDLRRREYFYERTVHECDLAAGRRSEFTVVALRLREPGVEGPDDKRIFEGLEALEPLVKEQDCLAVLGPHEIGVLAPRIKSNDAELFAEQLRNCIVASTQRSLEVHAGFAVYGVDATEAGSLVGIARQRMLEKAGKGPWDGSARDAPAPSNAATAEEGQGTGSAAAAT